MSRLQLHPVVCADRCYAYDAHSMAIRRVHPGMIRQLLASRAGPRVSHPAAQLPAPHPTEWPTCASLILNLTHACNLRCEYCFVREQAARGTAVRAPKPMPLDLAIAAVDAFYPDHQKRETGRIRVGFFGGEPLMAWDTLRRVVEHAERRDPGARFSCTTNATLMDQDKADFIAARKGRFSFIVSLDGNRARHNILRPLASDSGGPSSHDRTLAGLRLLAGAGIRPTLRGTFTARGCDLAAELEYLNGLCDQGLAGHVSVEPVSLTEGCAFGRHAISLQRMHELEPMFMAAADWFAARAASGMRARYHHLTKTLERLIRRTPACTECGAGRAYLTVNPQGEIHACHREKSRIGRMRSRGRLSFLDGETSVIHDGWDVKWEFAREAWRDNRLDAHRDCPSCSIRYLCGGGCRLDALDQTGDVRKPDPVGCAFAHLRLQMAVRVMDAVGPEACARACGLPPRRRRMAG